MNSYCPTVDVENSNDINVESSLEKELKQIDEIYENDLYHFNLIERENIEVLHNISRNIQRKSGNIQDKNSEEKSNKINLPGYHSINIEVVVNSKIIFDSIASNPYEQKDLIKRSNLTDEEKANILLCSNIFYLNDKKVTKIKNLEIYPHLVELYLQRNFIKKIEGLECLKSLKILSLNNNYISKVEGLTNLFSLKILDIGDNLIEKLYINDFPPSLSYLYLFDNIFYDTMSLYQLRAICINHFPDLIRLDGLNITDLERMMLTDEDLTDCNFFIENSTGHKLNYVKDHYNNMRKQRAEVLKNFSIPENGSSLDTLENKEVVSNFLTNELYSARLNLHKIKEEIYQRKIDFHADSSLRMSNLKEKLNDILHKVRDTPVIDDYRRNRIVGRINQAIKFDQKKEMAEAIMNRLNEKSENIPKIRKGNLPSESMQNELKELLSCDKFDEDIRGDNMLLTDMSDLSLIDKLK